MPVKVRDVRLPRTDKDDDDDDKYHGARGGSFDPISIRVTHDWSLGSVPRHEAMALSVGDAFELYKALKQVLEVA